jgi:hypothetical protein
MRDDKMTADELVNAAIEATMHSVASGPDERSRKKWIDEFRRSRYADGVLVAAAQLLIAGERHGGRAEATYTAALSRAGIKATQYATLAGWKQELVAASIAKMIELTGTATKRRGRPPKNGVAKTNLERQREFQARVRRAPDTIQKIKDALAAKDVAARKIVAIEKLIKEYESRE